MKNILPSKKFIYILLSIIIALGIIFLFSWIKDLRKTSAQNKIVANAVTINTAQKELIALDTDNDGLKDWEEALWKTDPNKSDTDSDGTDDLDEIKVNRDPLKPNTAKPREEPNDKVSEKIIQEDKKMVEDFQKLSDTDKVSRVILSQFLAIKKTDQDLTDEEIAYIIQSALSNTNELTFKQYELKDLKINPNNESSAIDLYGNTIIQTMQNFEQTNIDIYSVLDSIQEEDTSAQIKNKLTVIEPLISSLEEMILKMLSINTPPNRALKHLALINGFTQLADNLQQIIDSTPDPIKMFNLINTYPESQAKLQDAFYNFFVL